MSNDQNDQNDSDDDLMSAIKHVAKEMAEAMNIKTSQKLKETIDEPKVTNPPEEYEVVKTTQKNNNRYNDEEDNYTNNNTHYYNNNEYYDRVNNKSFYEREVEAHNSLQHKLELIRNKKIADEMKKYKTKPQLSENTKRIIKKKLANEKPLYQRSEEVVKQRNDKLEMLKNAYKELDEMEELEHRSRFNAPGLVDKEVIDNFIQDQFAWQKNKDDKMNFIKNEIEKIENEAAKTLHKPAILKTSENIAKAKNSKIREKDVHNRLHNHHEELLIKKQILQIKEIPTFTPVINKNIPKYANKTGNTANNNINSSKKQQTLTKKERLNNSAMEIYNHSKVDLQTNENHCEDGQYNNNYKDTDNFVDNIDEDPLISQYRLHLARSHLNSSPVKDLIKSKAVKMMSTVITNKIEEDRNSGVDPNWTYELDKVNEREADKTTNKLQQDRDLGNLYSINKSNATVWNKYGENKVVATPKFSSVVKNLK